MAKVQVTEPIPVAASLATGQVTVDTTVGGKLIVWGRRGRLSLVLVNLGTTDVYIGPVGVTTSTGQLLLGVKGAGLVLNMTGPVYGIVATGSQAVAFHEEYL